jgi:prepilin-type N-terminal cleavage/methylation domain-containing protein
MGSFFNWISNQLRSRRVSLSCTSQRGYTIIELMVVGAIVGILSVVILTSHVSFARRAALANAAYDVALTIRNAQIFGIGSRSTGTVGNAGYGMEFTPGSTFRMFADTNPAVPVNSTPNVRPGDGHYCSGVTATPPCTGADTPTQTYSLNNGIRVYRICGIRNDGFWYCNDVGLLANRISRLDIVFARPNTLASTSVLFTASNVWHWEDLTRACITLRDPQLNQRYITISYIGQIAMAASCP